MSSISLAGAKSHLSEIIDKVEAGESVEITRRGIAVAQLVPVKRSLRPVSVERLRASTDKIGRHGRSAGDIVREMRDSDRY